MLIRRKLFFKERHGLPGGQPFQRRLHIRFLDAGSFLCTKQEQAERILIRRLRTLGPADDGGVTHPLAVVPVCDQQVQRGGVGKGGVLAHGSILALLVAVGTEGRCVEGDQRSTGALCTHHALDGGVHQCGRGLLAGDQALHRGGVCVCGTIVGLPGRLNGGGIVGENVVVVWRFVTENQVGVSGQIFPFCVQQGMFCRLRRVPAVKISQNGFCGGVVHAVQQFMVQLGTGLEALFGAVRFALFICAQKIGRIVAQKVGSDADGTLDVGGYPQLPGDDDRLFALGLADAQVHNVHQLSGIVQTQLIAHLEAAVPAGCGDLALPQKLLIVGGQCLQDHVNTSTFRQSSTPSTSFARKN